MSSVGPPLPLFCRSGFLRETLSPVRPHISGGWPAAGPRGGRARAPTRLLELAPWSPPSARRLPMKEVGWGAGGFWWPCSRGGRLPTAPPEGPRPCAPLAPRAGPPSCSVCVSRWAAGPHARRPGPWTVTGGPSLGLQRPVARPWLAGDGQGPTLRGCCRRPPRRRPLAAARPGCLSLHAAPRHTFPVPLGRLPG